ncbi:uncharacterized protein LOC134832280 [Culicoides brevitarsis]|uniref:uncharacterized protein LOC134832280 n=1 Tax=Culicoides brevitarsis TaxID=469753 RepID=UPI00307C5579
MNSRPSASIGRQRRLTLLDANEDVDVYISIPTDKGYGWVIVAAAFLGNVLVDGVTFNFGSFLKPMCDTFGVKTASIALLLSVQSGIYYMSGPFISALINKIGFRLTGLIGAVLSSIGLLLSAYVESLPLISKENESIAAGLGYGIINCTGILITGHYFEKYRALANGITMSGSGAGTVLIGQLVTFLLKKYENDWRRILKILSALFLMTFPVVATYRPIKQKKVKITEKKLAFEDDEDSNSSRITIDFTKSRISMLPTLSIYTISEEESYESVGMKEPINVPNTPPINPKTRFRIFCKKICPCLFRERKKSLKFGRKVFSRPVYRDDAFYTHSMALLPEYDEIKSLIRSNSISPSYLNRQQMDDETIPYHLSVARVPSYDEFSKEKSWIDGFTGTIVRTLALLFDPKFFRIATFYFVAFAMMNNTVGMMLPSVFLIDRIKQEPDSDERVQYLMLAIGASNMMGRFSSGSLIFCKTASATLFAAFGALTCAISCFSIAFVENSHMTALILLCIIFGFSIGFSNSLRTIIYVENFGLENLTNVYGLVSVAIGIGAISGPLVAAYLKDTTHAYIWSFIYGGISLSLATLALFLTVILRKREQTRQ